MRVLQRTNLTDIPGPTISNCAPPQATVYGIESLHLLHQEAINYRHLVADIVVIDTPRARRPSFAPVCEFNISESLPEP